VPKRRSEIGDKRFGFREMGEKYRCKERDTLWKKKEVPVLRGEKTTRKESKFSEEHPNREEL